MATPGDQSAGGGSAARASKLRYPLRSASKGKAAAVPAAADAPPIVSAPRRAKPSSDVSKSMCVLDLSLKDKSAKPPRRHSIQTKPGASPRPTPSGTVTPLSGVRSRRSDSQGRFDTPTSEVSMSTTRRKFSTLSSISYWMTQIRLAEAASKHLVSLGFFKLALESECEPVERMREELKSYVARHSLATELEDPVKEILQVYDIVDDFEKLKITADPSQQPKCSDKAAPATNVSPNGNLKPRSLNSVATQNKETGKKENIQKEKVKPDARIRGSYNRNPAKNTTAKEVVAKNTGKKTKKQAKGQQEVCSGDSEALAALPDRESVDVKEITHEDKENMGDIEMSVDAGVAQEI